MKAQILNLMFFEQQLSRLYGALFCPIFVYLICLAHAMFLHTKCGCELIFFTTWSNDFIIFKTMNLCCLLLQGLSVDWISYKPHMEIRMLVMTVLVMASCFFFLLQDGGAHAQVPGSPLRSTGFCEEFVSPMNYKCIEEMVNINLYSSSSRAKAFKVSCLH